MSTTDTIDTIDVGLEYPEGPVEPALNARILQKIEKNLQMAKQA